MRVPFDPASLSASPVVSAEEKADALSLYAGFVAGGFRRREFTPEVARAAMSMFGIADSRASREWVFRVWFSVPDAREAWARRVLSSRSDLAASVSWAAAEVVFRDWLRAHLRRL